MKVRGVDLRIGWTRAFEECKRVRTARKKKLARNIMDLRTQSEARLAETGMEYLFYYLQCTCDVLTDGMKPLEDNQGSICFESFLQIHVH